MNQSTSDIEIHLVFGLQSGLLDALIWEQASRRLQRTDPVTKLCPVCSSRYFYIPAHCVLEPACASLAKQNPKERVSFGF